MYIDINETEDGNSDLLPFNLYVEGSYFGDSDIFFSDGRNVRDCTAIAQIESQLLTITRRELFELFRRFRTIAKEMKEVGLDRKKHHQKAIIRAVERYNEAVAEKNAGKVKEDGSPEEVFNSDVINTIKKKNVDYVNDE